MPPRFSLADAIETLREDSRALWVPTRIPEYTTAPSTVPFLRDHVSQSVPCVWRGAASGWAATRLWGADGFARLRAIAGEKEITVAVTPDGRADAISMQCDGDGDGDGDGKGLGGRRVFAQPLEERQRLGDFLSSLRADGEGGGRRWWAAGVGYYSAQDSSLVREVPELAADVGGAGAVRFAEEAFGGAASAHNVWIGDGRSVTTTHADPFENVYAVVCGRKRFWVRPPCDAAWVRKTRLRRARWGREDGGGGWRLRDEDGWTEWVEETDDGRGDGAVEVEVRAGDLLYLPALWLHRVEQEGVTMAVNWWFEMSFGQTWVHRELCANLRRCMEERRAGDGEGEGDRDGQDDGHAGKEASKHKAVSKR